MKQPAIDLQVIKVQSHFVPMGWLSNRAPMALFKRRGGSHICEQVALKKRVSQSLLLELESLTTIHYRGKYKDRLTEATKSQREILEAFGVGVQP